MVSVVAQDCIPLGPSRLCVDLIECLPTLREALERERGFRREQLADLTLERSSGLSSPGRGSTGAEGARREVHALLVAGARRALSDIERALAAMCVGQYGRCEDCAEEIPVAVLRAVPQVRRCLDCHRARSEVKPSGAPDEDGGAGAVAASADGPVEHSRPAQSIEAGEFAPAGPMRVLKIDELADDPRRGRSVVWMSQLLGRPIVGAEHQHLGHMRDIVADRVPDVGAVLTGLIADVGGQTIFVSAAAVRGWEASSGALEVLRHRPGYCRRPGEVLLAADVLGQPVMTSTAPTVARVADVALRRCAAGWTVWAVDIRSAGQRILGSSRRLVEWRALAQRLPVAPPRRGRQAAESEDLSDRDDSGRRESVPWRIRRPLAAREPSPPPEVGAPRIRGWTVGGRISPASGARSDPPGPRPGAGPPPGRARGQNSVPSQ